LPPAPRATLTGSRSAMARPSTAPGVRRAARQRSGQRAGGALRAGALTVCVLALAAIVVASGVIFLLGGPSAESHRVVLKRAFASLWDR